MHENKARCVKDVDIPDVNIIQRNPLELVVRLYESLED